MSTEEQEDSFLSEEQEKNIVEAIKAAELQTSGEIRIHIEQVCNKWNPLKRAKKLFHELEMDDTELQNGVLLYIASDDHKVAIFGGKAIDEKVGQLFWDDVLQQLIENFRNDYVEKGIKKAVHQIGEKLKVYFPYQEDDKNELSDEISTHDNRNE